MCLTALFLLSQAIMLKLWVGNMDLQGSKRNAVTVTGKHLTFLSIPVQWHGLSLSTDQGKIRDLFQIAAVSVWSRAQHMRSNKVVEHCWKPPSWKPLCFLMNSILGTAKSGIFPLVGSLSSPPLPPYMLVTTPSRSLTRPLCCSSSLPPLCLRPGSHHGSVCLSHCTSPPK